MKCKTEWLSFVLVAVFFVPAAFAFKLPDTGQTRCYQGVSPYAEIPCDGTGQDGEYSINPMSYTDNGNGTVTDNNTALIWQKEDDGSTYNWYQASGTYDGMYNPSSQDVCGSLDLGSYTDWRLPSKKELITLVDYSVPWPGPTINPVFTNTKQASYWVSTSANYYPGFAWLVDFAAGYVYGYYKDYAYYYVRCVRGEQLDSANLVDNSDGTITDARTDLVWQKQDGGIARTWQAALDYCNGLSLAGHTDWRLPNVKELESITDDSRHDLAIDPIFSGTSSDYWSSTTSANHPDPDYAWNANFNGGFVSSSPKRNDYDYVRCVRVRCGARPAVRTVPTLVYFTALMDAYDFVLDTETIEARATMFPGDLLFDLDKAVMFKGGFDCDYTMNPNWTIISGSLTITGGTVEVENIVIE